MFNIKRQTKLKYVILDNIIAIYNVNLNKRIMKYNVKLFIHKYFKSIFKIIVQNL